MSAFMHFAELEHRRYWSLFQAGYLKSAMLPIQVGNALLDASRIAMQFIMTKESCAVMCES